MRDKDMKLTKRFRKNLKTDLRIYIKIYSQSQKIEMNQSNI